MSVTGEFAACWAQSIPDPESRAQSVIGDLTPAQISTIKMRAQSLIDKLSSESHQVALGIDISENHDSPTKKKSRKAHNATKQDDGATTKQSSETEKQTTNTIQKLNDAKKFLSGAPVTDGTQLKEIQEVVVWLARPVWVLCDGTPWLSAKDNADFSPLLEPKRQQISSVANGIGLLSIYDSTTGRFIADIATAVGIGSRHVVTNTHVVTIAQLGYFDNVDKKWKLNDNVSAKISFPYEYRKCKTGARASTTVSVTGIAYVDQNLDVAILETNKDVAKVSFDENVDVIEGDRIAVLGYPSRPGDRDTFLSPIQIDAVFSSPDGRTPFPAERIATGKANRNDGVADGYFRYDATTWEGNSGSLVISLVNGKVIGLHARGLQAAAQGQGYNEGVLASEIYKILKREGY